MSHEDTLLMIDAIKSVASECNTIAFVMLACTGIRMVWDGWLATRRK